MDESSWLARNAHRVGPLIPLVIMLGGPVLMANFTIPLRDAPDGAVKVPFFERAWADAETMRDWRLLQAIREEQRREMFARIYYRECRANGATHSEALACAADAD